MTRSDQVTVMQRFARSFPKHPQPGPLDQVWCVPVAQALGFQFEFDAHFAAYAVPDNLMRRLSVGALDAGVAVEMTHIVFDFDCAGTHGTPEPASEAWRIKWRGQIEDLTCVHANPFTYETRGGARLTYALAEPTTLRSRADAQRWRQNYAIVCSYLARRFGILADPACADWTRLFRLPHVVRDGVRQQWRVHGDPCQIGTLEVNAEQGDLDATRALVPSAFRAPRIACQLRPSDQNRDRHLGVLFHALNARGHVFGQHDSSSYAVKCPNDAEHTTGSPADGSTLLYLPRPGGEVGALHCLHGHCTGKTVGQWLAHFSHEELGAARNAAGIRGFQWR